MQTSAKRRATKRQHAHDACKTSHHETGADRTLPNPQSVTTKTTSPDFLSDTCGASRGQRRQTRSATRAALPDVKPAQERRSHFLAWIQTRCRIDGPSSHLFSNRRIRRARQPALASRASPPRFLLSKHRRQYPIRSGQTTRWSRWQS